MSRARKVRHVDFLHPDGWREVHVVWRLPDGSCKVRLSALNRIRKRRSGYDSHFGKDAHRHFRDRQEPYTFTTVDQLLADFAKDVARLKREEVP